jgi:hypothetical protein
MYVGQEIRLRGVQFRNQRTQVDCDNIGAEVKCWFKDNGETPGDNSCDFQLTTALLRRLDGRGYDRIVDEENKERPIQNLRDLGKLRRAMRG